MVAAAADPDATLGNPMTDPMTSTACILCDQPCDLPPSRFRITVALGPRATGMLCHDCHRRIATTDETTMAATVEAHPLRTWNSRPFAGAIYYHFPGGAIQTTLRRAYAYCLYLNTKANPQAPT